MGMPKADASRPLIISTPQAPRDFSAATQVLYLRKSLLVADKWYTGYRLQGTGDGEKQNRLETVQSTVSTLTLTAISIYNRPTSNL